jgi:pimeloyl-ACP methyl ester carboxylesterase
VIPGKRRVINRGGHRGQVANGELGHEVKLSGETWNNLTGGAREACRRHASRQRCKRRLTLPILTVGGADADNLFRTMTQSSDDVRNVVFEGIGHHLPEECPEDLVDVILEFWKE